MAQNTGDSGKIFDVDSFGKIFSVDSFGKIFDKDSFAAAATAGDRRVSINTVEMKNGAVVDSALSTGTHRRIDSGEVSKKNDPDPSTNTHITRHDVENVFRASTTTGRVTREEIERIKKMHDKISSGTEVNFNYICLLSVASIVAGLGLASNSTTTVISSMLLSPLMGPVVGMSYGLVIWDIKLIKKSAITESVSILVCIIFGFLVSLLTSWTEMANDWPNEEMLSRGEISTFFTGIPIAFFSGLGVALSVLDDQTSSLVGVAISASLLPPAVNCGLLCFFALAVHTDPRDRWEEDEWESFVQMGAISLALTVANILVVWIGAALMMRVKEVLPIEKKIFWDDLKTARRIYQNRAYEDAISSEALGQTTDDHPHKNQDNVVYCEDIEQGLHATQTASGCSFEICLCEETAMR